MARSQAQMLDSEKELMGHFSIVYSPDDNGYYADMWWDNTLDCPIYRNGILARRWAAKHGGTTEH